MAFYNVDIKILHQFFGMFTIIFHSINAPINNIMLTKTISANKYAIDFLDILLFVISYRKIPPLESAMPYDTNSKIPNGVRKTISGFGYCTFDKFVIELKINPVENAEKPPITIPAIGINIAKAILRLFKKIPVSLMSCICSIKFLDNSSENDLFILIENPN